MSKHMQPRTFATQTVGLIFLAVLSLNSVWAQTNVTVPPSVAQRGSSFAVEVQINNVTNMQGSHVQFSFDNSLIHFDDVVPGAFYPAGSIFQSNPAPGAGVATVYIDQALAGGAPLSGSGVLFWISFTALQGGTGAITLPSVALRDASNGEIAAMTVPGSVTINNPIPSISTILPDTRDAGDPAFALTVNGSNFVPTSIVSFAGVPRATTVVSATQLTADILSADVAEGGLYDITVTNPAPAGGTSNAKVLTANYIIEASAGVHGSITPSGAHVVVPPNTNKTFTIAAEAHYHVANVLVDGSSVGAVTSYAFTNVTASHTINATFAIDQFTITAGAGANGSITPAGITTISYGGSQSYDIAADVGYHVVDVLVDGVSVGAVTSYDFTNVTTNHTISATFSINVFTITGTAGANGSVTPPGVTSIGYGSNVTYTITPNTGYHVVDVLVDDMSVGAVTSYDFTNVTANHTISATFTINIYTITASAGLDGWILPSGASSVAHGGSQSYTITPDAGYHVADVLVDGVTVGAVTTYDFLDVTANHTIVASFAINVFTITATAGSNGSINPPGVSDVNSGDNKVYTMTPDPDYHLGGLVVDAIAVDPLLNPYMFTDVNANHTIHATFAQNTYTVSGIGVYWVDLNGDGTYDMRLNFATVPIGGGTFSASEYFGVPPTGHTRPPDALACYLQMTTSMPPHSFSVQVTVDMSGIAGFGSTTSLVYYSMATSSWVSVAGAFAATSSYFDASHAVYGFTIDHFSDFTFFNPAPGGASDLYIGANATATWGCLVYPNTSWGPPTPHEPADWSWTGAQPLDFYLVPKVGASFNSGDITLEWDNSVMTYASSEFASGGLFSSGVVTTPAPNRLQIQVASPSDVTVASGHYIAKLGFTLLKPGHSVLAVVGASFQNQASATVFMTPLHGEVKAYLGDFGKSGDPNTGDGKIDIWDLSPWSLSYWSGVSGGPGMADYKVKYDIGPTVDHTPFTLPQVDSKIDFEDLLIFSISFGQNAANQLPKLQAVSGDPVEVSMGKPTMNGNEMCVPVVVAGGVTDIRGMKIQVTGQFDAFLGAEKGRLLQNYETPVMMLSRSAGRNVFVDFAVMGLDAKGIQQAGEVVVLRFAGKTSVQVTIAEARNSQNMRLEVVRKNGTSEMTPTAYRLAQNYPNPFNPTTTIAYDLPQPGKVRLEVNNLLGERITTLVDAVQDAGFYRVEWNGKDENQAPVAVGVYFCRLHAGNFTSVKKMLFLK
jgi:hypothetical protein